MLDQSDLIGRPTVPSLQKVIPFRQKAARDRALFADAQRLHRRPRRKHQHLNYWEVWSFKLNRAVGLYRNLNYDYWFVIEGNPDIVWYIEYPVPFYLELKSRRVSCQFDCIYERRDGEQVCVRLVEQGTGSTPREQEVARAEREWCTMHGFGYERISRAELNRHRWFIINWKGMLPYLERANGWIETQILKCLETGDITLGRLEKVLLLSLDLQVVRASLYRLIHQGKVVVPQLHKGPLEQDTVISRGCQ
jgi:hypothetical protein